MGAFRTWAVRCTPGLSAVSLILLSVIALADLRPVWRLFGCRCTPTLPLRDDVPVLASYALMVWTAYAVLVHLVAFAFPLRLCHATWQLTERIEEAHAKLARDLPLQRGRPRMRPRSSENSPESPLSPVDKKPDLVISCYELFEPIHVILLPCYKEDIETIKFTLKVLASHELAASTYDVFLAMEQRDPKAVPVAEQVINTFQGKFRDIQYTVHPGNLPGEAAGKSSNVSWAARQALFKYKSTDQWKDALLTIMDSDTHLSTDYFKLLTQQHRVNREQGAFEVLYMPPVVFDRNALRVPLLVRIADMMWTAACLSMCSTNSPVTIPTSVYSVPVPLAARVGGWDTGPEAIGEDLHMMLKCYFNTNAKLDMQSIPSPASQCNVSVSERGVRGWIGGLRARYWQGLRHMWGCLDTGYSLNQFSAMYRRGDEEEETNYDGNEYVESVRSGSLKSSASSETLVASDIDPLGSPIDNEKQRQTPPQPKFSRWYRTMTVFFRLFEAHMVPIHMAVVLIASTFYGNTVPVKEQPWLVVVGLFIMGTSRALAFFVMVLYFIVFYDRYHRLAVERREAEMKRVNLYEECDLPSSFAHRSIQDWRCWADCLSFVVGGFIFGSIPALHAVVAHFWTDRLEYVVSKKPQLRATTEEMTVKEV